jgi:hypothetical protein
LLPGWNPESAKREVKKLAITTKGARLWAARLEGAMASKGEQWYARQANRGKAVRSAIGNDEISRLLPWWSKLVHQRLLAEAAELDPGREASDEREDRHFTSGAACVRVRAAVDGSSGS